ncbi:MAG: hypothetical protein H6732_06290 [Alphaproteobacteria bacterium]|nr:hypothetical protein [Alphaproteobacteria bacterium]
MLVFGVLEATALLVASSCGIVSLCESGIEGEFRLVTVRRRAIGQAQWEEEPATEWRDFARFDAVLAGVLTGECDGRLDAHAGGRIAVTGPDRSVFRASDDSSAEVGDDR